MAVVEAPIRTRVYIGLSSPVIFAVRPVAPLIVPQCAPEFRAAPRTAVAYPTIRAGVISILNETLSLLVACGIRLRPREAVSAG